MQIFFTTIHPQKNPSTNQQNRTCFRKKREFHVVSKESVSAICEGMVSRPVIETACVSAKVLDSEEFEEMEAVTPKDVKLAQRRYPAIGDQGWVMW